MAPIGAKLGQNTFQRIPDISFFDAEKKLQTLNGRLPPEDGSVRRETLGKRVSDDSRHFIFRRPKKLFGDFFFQKNFGLIFFVKKVAFWRSYGFLDVMGRCASTNDPRSFDYQLYTTFRRGVKVVHTVFEAVFGPKRTSNIWCYDVMIL